MFYVEKWNRDNKKEMALLHIGPPLLVFLAFLAITIWSWVDARHSLEDARSQRLSLYLSETEAGLKERLQTYEDILRAGTGLYENSTDVTRQEWKDFIEIFDLQTRYPGIQGIGYSEVVPENRIAQHEQNYRDSTYPKYSLHPKGERDFYTSIVYLEPKNAANDEAIGFDMASDETRREAMFLARDTGDTALTQTVELIQEKAQPDKQSGFLMYVPLYKQNTVNESVEERRLNIAGFIYAPFRGNDLINALTSNTSHGGYGFQIYESNVVDEKKLFESQKFDEISRGDKTSEMVKHFSVNNRTWIIRGVVDSSAIPGSETNRPVTILWIGTVFSIILALLIYILLLNRSRVLSNKETMEIQNAKDELLALASHQLRTPATGVKQYLGLLREGYAGKLNKDQRLYIRKAYESNERQLNTINQMLFVARSDAGKIKLTIRHLDMRDLLKDIIDEQKSQIAEKKHKVTVDLPDYAVDVYGDEQYLRMALENVISNAIKYTEPGGKITVSLQTAGNDLRIIVEDNGVGVQQEDLTLLFRKFSRIPNELTSKVPGSGIGLYLTKSIIKAHNGSVHFESIVDEGSKITIMLPRKLPKEGATL